MYTVQYLGGRKRICFGSVPCSC